MCKFVLKKMKKRKFMMILKEFLFSRHSDNWRHSVINHCDRHITHPGDTDTVQSEI